MFGERLMNIEDVALIELGAGIEGVLGVLLILGRLLALDGDGCTEGVEPMLLNEVDVVEFP